VHDRRQFARQLHEQAVSAAVSFATLAGAGHEPTGVSPPVTGLKLVRGSWAATPTLRDLMMAIRPRAGDRCPTSGCAPIAAHFASVYGDGLSPHLGVSVAGDLVLDWVTETVVLQIVHEALHNVWRHSDACEVQVTIELDDGVVRLRVRDDGAGDETVPEGPGVVSMRASAVVVGGPHGLVPAAWARPSTPASAAVARPAPTRPRSPPPSPRKFRPAGLAWSPTLACRLASPEDDRELPTDR
jgi:glucose-6-phosphate-specific signal transduction histidine kinase